MTSALMAMIKGAKNKYSRNTGKSVKIKEGRTQVRILQANEADKFWRDLGVHWIKTEKDGKPVAVVGCHDIVKDQPCPICTAIDKSSRAAPDDDTLAIVKEWKVKKSVLVNALIRSGPEASEDPVVLELAVGTFGDILSMAEEYVADYGNVFSPDKGMDFTIERKGKLKDTTYTVMPKPNAKPVSKQSLEKMIDLDDFIEKEFFRGDEMKALNAISGMMGIPMNGPALAGPRGNALLTNRSAQVEDAVIEEPEEIVPPKIVQRVAPKVEIVEQPAIDESGIDEEAAEMERMEQELAAKKAAMAAKKASPVTTTSSKGAVVKEAITGKKPDDFGAPLAAEDVDSLMSELDNLTV